MPQSTSIPSPHGGDRRFEALAERAPVGIFEMDAEGNCIYANARASEMTGVPVPEMRGREWARHLHPEDRARLQGNYYLAIGQGEPFQAEYRFVHPSGKTVWVFGQGVPLRDADGGLTGFVGTLTDLTERKRIEEELAENETRLRLMLEQVPAIVWTTDRALRTISSLGKGLAQVNLLPNQLVGTNLYELLKKDRPALEAHERALDGTLSSYEYPWLEHTFQTHIEPLRDSKGQIIGTVGIALDISERKRAEEKLQEMNEKLELRVAERTRALSITNEALQREIDDRKLAEQRLRQSEEHYRELWESNRLLLRELDHRVGNNLAGLLSLVGLMRRNAGGVDEMASALEARLGAMAHIHRLLAETGWQDVDLEQLVCSLLDAMASMECDPVALTVSGPSVAVVAGKALPLAMILLEWFTNSCKHGVHSAGGGSLKIRWEVLESAAGQRVRLQWTETNGPPVRQPVVPSLGTELVQGFASRELAGRCELNYPRGGADHLLEFPPRKN